MTPRQTNRSEDDPDGDDDLADEDFEAASIDDNDEPTIPCPYCGREILEDLVRCPCCERYLSHEDAPPRPKSWLIVVGTVLCLYVVYRWIVG